MTDNGWDDLFAKASGEQESSKSNDIRPSGKRNNSSISNVQKKSKKKLKRKNDWNDDGAVDEFLATRMASEQNPSWPLSLSLGASQGPDCLGWKHVDGDNGSKGACGRCKRSALFHRLKLDDTQKKSWAIEMFAIVRNVRCCAALMLSLNEVERVSLSLALTLEAKRMRSLKSSFQCTLDSGAASLLEDKCNNFIKCIENLDRQVKREKKGSGESKLSGLDTMIRLIITSDALYYRLYYLQITKAVPQNSTFIPHPTTYFVVPHLCWDVEEGEAYLKEFVGTIRKDLKDSKSEDPILKSLLCRYGVSSDGKTKYRAHDHPLARLHYNRLLETLVRFQKSGWTSQTQAVASLMPKIDTDDELACHETPAPSILMEWRDSCRDLLCNLYAYATLSPGTIQRIRTIFEIYGIKGGAVELGSGTGYIAKMLKDARVTVVAWDVRPTEQTKAFKPTNEYHGCTPPFFSVQRGDVGTLQSFFRHTRSEYKNEKVALLLSYPPPQSLMAYHALRTYLSAGGRCLVHVGEFRGLTGSEEMEEVLLGNFKCVDRTPCLCWGTDAAEVSIWIRHKKDGVEPAPDDQTGHVLLPCSHCGKREATKRCKLLRFLVYCGEECFRADHEQVKVDLKMNMISDGGRSLDFNDESHFITISSLNTRASSQKLKKGK